MATRPVQSIIAITLAFVTAAGLAEDPGVDGSELYMSYQCWQCHGYEGQGGPGPRIASKGYSLEAFERFVRHPNLMPAYTRNMLSDDELRRIYEFVISIPEPPALEDIPALSEM